MERRVAGNTQGSRVKEKFGEGGHTWKEQGRSNRWIGKGKGMNRMITIVGGKQERGDKEKGRGRGRKRKRRQREGKRKEKEEKIKKREEDEEEKEREDKEKVRRRERESKRKRMRR